MEPNLHTNQRLVIEKLSYHFHGRRRGDVVVLHDPGGSPESLIKRVIGLPGQRITVTDGALMLTAHRWTSRIWRTRHRAVGGHGSCRR